MITTGIMATIDRSNNDEIARVYQRVIGWGVPAKEIKLVMEGLGDTTSLGFTTDWLQDANRPAGDGPSMLVLAGPKGVGKTVAAVHAMFHADPTQPHGMKWKTEQSPKFRHVSEIAEIGVFGGEDERKFRSDIKQTKCLVIDDVGVEYMSEPFLALFDAIVNARYGSFGLTIFTTNLTAQQWSSRYGERVYDRIRGRGEWFDIDEESLRGKSS